MSEEVEEITKTPVKESVKREKDPKKAAAGKKLAEYNRRAKEALKEKMKREAEKATEPEERDEQSKDLTAEKLESAEQGSRMEGWIPEISFTTAISLVGIGLTALNMFMSYRKDTKVDTPLTEPHLCDRQGVSKIPIPKMGMH